MLAACLDGEPKAPFDVPSHLQQCAACRTGLRHARRLDALIASTSAATLDDDVAARLLARAFPPAVRPVRRAVLPVAVVAATTLALGIWIGTRLAPTALEPATVAIAAAADGPASGAATADATLLRLPAAATRPGIRNAPQRATSTPRAATDPTVVHACLPTTTLAVMLTTRAVFDVLLPGNGSRGGTLANLRATAARLADAARIAAGRELLRSTRPGDQDRLFELLATAADGPALQQLLALAQDDAGVVRRLHRDIAGAGDADIVLAVAARLAHPRIDRLLVQKVRRRSRCADAIAAAMLGLERRPRRLELLLELWDEQQIWSATETAQVESWFRALPASTTRELVACVEQSRRPDRRLQCLRVLGWRADPAGLNCLFAQVEGSRYETALAAGLALCRFPRAVVEARIDACMRTSRRPHVLLAALCALDSPLARNRIRLADLSREEAQFLWSGGFTEKQFAIACTLCRRRSPISD